MVSPGEFLLFKYKQKSITAALKKRQTPSQSRKQDVSPKTSIISFDEMYELQTEKLFPMGEHIKCQMSKPQNLFDKLSIKSQPLRRQLVKYLPR